MCKAEYSVKYASYLNKPGKNKEHYKTYLSITKSFLFVYSMHANPIRLIAN